MKETKVRQGKTGERQSQKKPTKRRLKNEKRKEGGITKYKYK